MLLLAHRNEAVDNAAYLCGSMARVRYPLAPPHDRRRCRRRRGSGRPGTTDGFTARPPSGEISDPATACPWERGISGSYMPALNRFAAPATPSPQGGSVSLDLNIVAKARYCRPEYPAEPRRSVSMISADRRSKRSRRATISRSTGCCSSAPGVAQDIWPWPAPCPRRSRQPAISPERSDPARGINVFGQDLQTFVWPIPCR